MDDATGLAEALLGLDGFRVLEVSETPDEVVTHLPPLWGAGPRQGAPARRHQRPALFRTTGPAHLDEAALAVPRSRL